MDKIRSAAIVLLGLGEKCASDILKTMSPKVVRAILEAINSIQQVSEEEVLEALKNFFHESNSSIDAVASKEQFKNSVLSAVGNKGFAGIIEELSGVSDKWLDLIKKQPTNVILELIQDEHPQVITALMVIIFSYISSDYGTKLIKSMPKPLQSQVFKKMTNMGSMTKIGMTFFAEFFEKELAGADKNNIIALDGVEAVAHIMSCMDSGTENEIMTDLTGDNKELQEEIQGKMFPFHKLSEMDSKSLQTLLGEVKNEDLLIALKGVDEQVKEAFLKNMSSKSADMLREEMESKGPVKLTNVMDAQKRIIMVAKKLADEDKIILNSKNNSDVIF